MGAERPDVARALCPVCQDTPVPEGARWCSEACRVAAWRRRRRAAGIPLKAPKAPARRETTVHICTACGTRIMGRRWCPACGSPTRNAGFGGACPHCAQPVAVSELLDQVEAIIADRAERTEGGDAAPALD